jgi:N-acetylglutamate synthase-like GNAT family acetyltransferase
MLLASDMDTRTDLSPWLAGVFVLPEYRGRGVAKALTLQVMKRAAELEFENMYLYTPGAEGFYAKLGWKVLERPVYRETPVTIMSASL